jgi:hypothetical protein
VFWSAILLICHFTFSFAGLHGWLSLLRLLIALIQHSLLLGATGMPYQHGWDSMPGPVTERRSVTEPRCPAVAVTLITPRLTNASEGCAQRTTDGCSILDSSRCFWIVARDSSNDHKVTGKGGETTWLQLVGMINRLTIRFLPRSPSSVPAADETAESVSLPHNVVHHTSMRRQTEF